MKNKIKVNGIIDGCLECDEEEKILATYEELKNDIEVKPTEIPIHPNLSE